MIKFNPFLEYSITDFNQYKSVPFLEMNSIKLIKNNIEGRIRDNFVYPERLLIIGQRGIGKTTTLFFIKDLLDKSNVQNFLFSRLINSSEHFRIITGEYLEKVSNKPIFILLDFPDSIDTKNFKEFLDFVWSLLTHKNNKNINLVFALNISHYNSSLFFSEILGKFHRTRLDNLNEMETLDLINARLSVAKDKEFFDTDTKKVIFTYSHGIPRNIICASKDLVDSFINKRQVSKQMAESVLKEEYVNRIIHDRVEDLEERKTFLNLVALIKKDFGGRVGSQEILVRSAKDQIGIGRNKTLHYVSELSKFGLLTIIKGGDKLNKKVLILK